MPRKLTTEEFIEKARSVHGDKYDYSLVDYKSSKEKIAIKCDKGHVFEQTPNSHLSGQECPNCRGYNKTTEYVIKEFKNTHGDKYDYSLVEYIGCNNKVKIICPDHGMFEQRYSDHVRGQRCPKCRGYYKTTEELIKEFKKIHDDKYDYSFVEYKTAKTKLKIICHEHGVFKQTSNDHLNRVGCPKCGRQRTEISAKNNPTGWSATNWENKALRSKYFDSFKVYIIRCWNDNEEFYKIGRTFLTTKRRFRDKKSMPYNYEVLEEIIFDKARDCFNKEAELKRINKENKYFPLVFFKGMNECFSQIKKTIY